MPACDHSLEDFYAMSLAAKPELEFALAIATAPNHRNGLQLALQLVSGVCGYAAETHAATERNEIDLIEKLNKHLIERAGTR